MRAGTCARSFLAALAICAAGASATATDTPEAKAERAARAWLATVDAGNYNESWQAAPGYFRNAVGQDQWRQTLEAVRRPLGQVLTREVAARTYLTELPGAPDGQYVVIQFNTSFDKKRIAVETVTPMMEDDGGWRVAGFFIK